MENWFISFEADFVKNSPIYMKFIKNNMERTIRNQIYLLSLL